MSTTTTTAMASGTTKTSSRSAPDAIAGTRLPEEKPNPEALTLVAQLRPADAVIHESSIRVAAGIAPPVTERDAAATVRSSASASALPVLGGALGHEEDG